MAAGTPPQLRLRATSSTTTAPGAVFNEIFQALGPCYKPMLFKNNGNRPSIHSRLSYMKIRSLTSLARSLFFFGWLQAPSSFSTESTHVGTSHSQEPQQATAQDTRSESTPEEDEISVPELIEKAMRARDLLNLQFARHSLNRSNHAVLFTLAESACVLNDMARVLTERQLRIELLTRELFIEKMTRRARELELARATQGDAAAAAAAEL